VQLAAAPPRALLSISIILITVIASWRQKGSNYLSLKCSIATLRSFNSIGDNMDRHGLFDRLADSPISQMRGLKFFHLCFR
jgi:hypothetical protein